MPEFMMSVYFVPIVCVVFFIIMVSVVALCIAHKNKQYKLIKNGPYAEATIISADKQKNTLMEGIHYEWRCEVSYTISDGTAHKGVIFINDIGVDVPIGGKVRIAYNPKKPNKAYLSNLLYMQTPEYIALMEANGFTYTGNSFVKKSTQTSTRSVAARRTEWED